MVRQRTIKQERMTGLTWTEVQFAFEVLETLHHHYADNDMLDESTTMNEAYYLLDDFARGAKWNTETIA